MKPDFKIGDKVYTDVPEQYDRETYKGTLVEIDDFLGKVEFPNGFWRWVHLRKLRQVNRK